jgi:hypothetical protein
MALNLNDRVYATHVYREKGPYWVIDIDSQLHPAKGNFFVTPSLFPKRPRK